MLLLLIRPCQYYTYMVNLSGLKCLPLMTHDIKIPLNGSVIVGDVLATTAMKILLRKTQLSLIFN